jgi:hypothetical protein
LKQLWSCGHENIFHIQSCPSFFSVLGDHKTSLYSSAKIWMEPTRLWAPHGACLAMLPGWFSNLRAHGFWAHS